MRPPVHASLAVLTSVALLSLLTACGGGGAAEEASSANLVLPAATTAEETSDGTAQALSLALKRAAPRSVTLTVRAHGSLAGGVGPLMEVWVRGGKLATVEVRSLEPQDYSFSVASLSAGDRVDLVFTNDALINGQDRNLFITGVSDGTVMVAPTQPGAQVDTGVGSAAFDGQHTGPGSEALWGPAALRLVWPASTDYTVNARDAEISRFLQQATFGPTRSELARLRSMSFGTWIDEQIAMPPRSDMVAFIQQKYDQGSDYQPPSGERYTPDWVSEKFWTNAVTASDPLRKRVAFALHSIFVVSQADSNLFHHARAYAGYLDTLDRLAFSNYRTLIEELALHPAMGIYLSHMRNMKEDPATNRTPDENFARELLQLFSIGLYELNPDGSWKLDSRGQPIETYGNADVMAMARVFTGWSWGFDDNQLTDHNFRWGWPDARSTGHARVDLRRMKPYPALASTLEKRLFAGKPNAVTIPANTGPQESVRLALDSVFNHPNVGPFIGRQLIQRLVTSNPSPAYVARVAHAFNNNGRGERGDLAAVVRAVLLDPEARGTASAQFGKLREPVLRLGHAMRAFDAISTSGQYGVGTEPAGIGQRVNNMSSVFGYFRPGYIPPNTALGNMGQGSPEMQIVDESTTAAWINGVELMLREGMGWHGTSRTVQFPLHHQIDLVRRGPGLLVNQLNLMLFAGQMSAALRKDIFDAMQSVPTSATDRDRQRAQVALFVALTSPEYIVQR